MSLKRFPVHTFITDKNKGDISYGQTEKLTQIDWSIE